MNVIARTFRELITTLRITPESHRTDDLCRELVAQLSRLPNRHALVAFIHQGNLETYYWHDGALHFLSLHGLYLSQREHAHGKGWFIFVELRPNTVTAHHNYVDPNQPRPTDLLAA
jgi:hypothetical protein